VEAGKLRLLSPREVMEETRELIKNLKLRDCVFRSNHASNYLALAGNLTADRDRLLREINDALNEDYDFKDEYFRRL
ncbi:MAG: radical SAM protein, partial [Clostridia bacterium]|nr:radical SAM protein [Clostridia bacterium]